MKDKDNLKKWLKTNEKYFEANPQVLRSMMNNPSFLSSFNELMLNRKAKLAKRVARIERRSYKKQKAGGTTAAMKKRRSLLRLPSLSEVNERLHQANDFINAIKSMTGKM